MSQTFNSAYQSTDPLNVLILGTIPNALDALRTLFSGSSAPASPSAYQLWADTSTGLLKQRNAANNAWNVLMPMGIDARQQIPSQWDVASLSATTTKKLGAVPRACTVKRLLVLCETASTSSSGNEWQFTLNKRTNASPGSTVALFSATVGTFTSLGGVGGGAEFVAHKVYALAPNQNNTLAIDDVLELTMTKVGTATTLTNLTAWVEIE